MYRIYSALIEIVAAAVFIIPIWCLYNKLCFHSWKRTILYMVFGFYFTAVLALVGFPNIASLKTIISYYENDKKEMRASGLAEIAKVLQTTPNYLLGFADNNDGFADEALGLLRDVKDQSVREIFLKQIRALI